MAVLLEHAKLYVRHIANISSWVLSIAAGTLLSTERVVSMERLPRRNVSAGVLSGREGAKHSRLATQLAAKKQRHSFHERSSQQGPQVRRAHVLGSCKL